MAGGGFIAAVTGAAAAGAAAAGAASTVGVAMACG